MTSLGLGACASEGQPIGAPRVDGALPVPGSQAARQFRRDIRRQVDLRYLLFLPRGYAVAREPWPLLLFLHGAGERGEDLERVKIHGPPKRVAGWPDFPFVLVSPQVSESMAWDSVALASLLDELLATLHLDPDRVLVTGLSMGGHGTWRFATDFPERVAAIAPVCGAGEPYRVCRIRHVPVWAFHGALDTVVLPRTDELTVEALRACGGNVRYTVYPDLGHDAWTRTYDDPALYEWLLAQRRR